MTAIHNHRSNKAITRLIQFVFALMLIFTSLAATGCGVVDSNETERVIMAENPTATVEGVTKPDSESDATKESDPGDSDDSDDFDSYGNPVKDGR